MKALTVIKTFLLVAGMSVAAKAQTSADDMVREWERAKAYTKAYLDVMPEADYALKPTPEMRTFAQQMLHLTDGNMLFATTALGEKMPEGGQREKIADQSKANVIKEVMAGYDYVIAAIKKLPADQWKDKIKMFNRFELTKGQAFEKAFEHQTHHRGQTTVYIRLAKATPPQEQLF
ncbi:DinB family protein [Chitinophaga lutea]|uniref:DinB family protein n=1 Tax=Chitinophaga lutea TaxID=2488634 RepID=A0A3N4PHD7_9BACT|nr:DinB family protein [Chitinophaga lutea]RPE08113.1 DinB family protein [Chitinophaga lutea]